jgi:predicted SprT family Zn-dependent metalloprotease
MERTKFSTLDQLKDQITKEMHKDYFFNGEVFNPLNEGWWFQFDNGTRRMGQCSIHLKRISLSRKMCELNMNRWDLIEDILLHELAHAFTEKIYGKESSGHTPQFRRIAKSMGSSLLGSMIPKSFGLRVPYRYKYRCPGCGGTWERQKKIEGSCRACSGSNIYDPKFKLVLVDEAL